MSASRSGGLQSIGKCDHSVTSEYLIFGPPGTGKTTSLADQIRRAADIYGSDRILVTSFSRAAAAEVAGRGTPLGGSQIGTLHSHCWHALGRPAIAEVHVTEWNRINPGAQITQLRKPTGILDGDETGEDESAESKSGDALLQRLNRCRGMDAPRATWSPQVLAFEYSWVAYKRSHRLMDFCDLIETAIFDIAVAPGSPAVMFADEVQDLNPMQSRLVRSWGEKCEYFVLAGDDDQTIYTFAGATPETMLRPGIPDDHKIILSQSYRVPAAVQSFAEGLIRRVHRRQDKCYLARPEQGAVSRIAGGYKSPEYAILASALDHLSRGRSIMFLASCAYMLGPLIQVLRKHAIPFHNPYRRSVGFWNPLRPGSKGSAANRIAALLAPLGGDEPRRWTHAEFSLFVEWLAGTGTLRNDQLRAAGAALSKQAVTMEYLAEVFEPEALASLQRAFATGPPRLLEWWRGRIHPQFRKRVQFPLSVAASGGAAAISAEPKVTVGTIHSVKGGQADVVYLFPDLSSAGDLTNRGTVDQRDYMTRLFYVGATRARQELCICGNETGRRFAL